MKRAITIMLTFFVIGTLSAQQPVEKTLIKPVNLAGKLKVEAQLNGEINVKEWTNSHAKIEMSITAYGVNSQVVKSLVAAGRYNITVKHEGDKVVLSTPNLAKALKVRGNSLKDEVKFVLYVPTGCQVGEEGNIGMTSAN